MKAIRGCSLLRDWPAMAGSTCLCFLLTLGCGGCGGSAAASLRTGQTPAVGLTLATVMKGEAVCIQATVVNQTSEPVYVCATPCPDRSGKERPNLHYVGDGTLALCWAVVAVPDGAERLMVGAKAKRLGAGDKMILEVTLPRVVRENSPWGNFLYNNWSEKNKSVLAEEQGETRYWETANSVCVVVSYWEEKALLALKDNTLVESIRKAINEKSSGKIWIPDNGAVGDWSKLPPASRLAAIRRGIERGRMLSYLDILSTLEIQLDVVAGPAQLPQPIVVTW